ncbi:MAG: DUF1559 domain-containing protein [Planctomycetes bacterium]|nr:DUF1559 domain-containing protein [Planctomycetota bacterium]
MGGYDYFGSAHSAGFEGALADGSVRSIAYSIPLQVLADLTNRSDGNVLDWSLAGL